MGTPIRETRIYYLRDEETQITKDLHRETDCLQSLDQMRKDGLYTDFVFVVGSRRFHVHKLVVASLSDYFDNLLQGGNRSIPSSEMTLNDLSPDHFSAMLDYAYTGCLPLTKYNVSGLQVVAERFGITSMIELCQTYQLAHMSIKDE